MGFVTCSFSFNKYQIMECNKILYENQQNAGLVAWWHMHAGANVVARRHMLAGTSPPHHR